MEFEFLSLESVLEIHRDQVGRYGGSEGVRDVGLLESALAMPQSGSAGQYFHSDLFEMAAAYLLYLVRGNASKSSARRDSAARNWLSNGRINHAFVDGNKRTGTATALVFLRIHGVEVVVSDPVLIETVVEVAEGKIEKPQLAAFFRKHSRRKR